MKKKRILTYALGMALALTGLQACSDDDCGGCILPPGARANALVTVKPQGEGKTVLLQLDDSTTMTPVNMAQSPFGEKEVRALCHFRLAEEPADKRHLKVYINWMDSILTKRMAPDLGETENVKTYGTDPVEIMRDWTTVAEDGYLTLRFLTRWGDNTPHLVNLVADNASKPYELTFHHKGNTNGPVGYGLVAFKLSDLPDTNGKTVDVKLKWTSFSGPKEVTFKYCTQRSTGSASSLVQDLTDLRSVR